MELKYFLSHSLIHSCIHSCAQQIFTGCLLCGKHRTRHQGNRDTPCPEGVSSVTSLGHTCLETKERSIRGREKEEAFVYEIHKFMGSHLEPNRPWLTGSKAGGLLEADVDTRNDSRELNV